MIALSLALVALSALGPRSSASDVVSLKDGTKVEGRVVFESAQKVVVRVGSREREIATAEVAEVKSAARNLRTALERWEQLHAQDAAAIAELARSCKEQGLEGEAQLFALGALAVDPALEGAHELLGHERRDGKWRVREGSKAFTYAELLELRRDFKDGWHLTTTHFDVRTNLAPAQAVAAVLELEFCYRTFFEWFGEAVELYEVVEPMLAQIHADKRSYPGGDERSGFYDPGLNTLFIDASSSLELPTLAHEAAHEVLINTAVKTRAGRGEIPPWLNEGLAQYLEFSRSGEAGRPRYSKGAPEKRLFALHAQAKKPFDLSRVLALATEDFTYSSRVQLTYAQSYTLVHYCLHGEDGGRRAGFFEFLRRCYRGKASMTDFKSALDVKERAFEKAWIEYAKNES